MTDEHIRVMHIVNELIPKFMGSNFEPVEVYAAMEFLMLTALKSNPGLTERGKTLAGELMAEFERRKA